MKPWHKHQLDAIGTRWSIETSTALHADELNKINSTIEDFDKAYSRFRSDSLVSIMRDTGESQVFPHSITDILGVYKKLHDVTDGAVNPLVGGSLESLGYDANYSLKSRGAQPAPPFSQLLCNRTSVTLPAGSLLDIGAAGKGYLADQIARVVAKKHSSYVIDASGDIAVHTNQAEVIGLEHPLYVNRVIGAVQLSRHSLCASAPNRRKWSDELHHILDARTGLPAHGDIVATWAIADTTFLADALSTGLFFVSYQDLQNVFGDFYYVIMNREGSVRHNIDSIGEIYT